MEYAIWILEKEVREIEHNVKDKNLMQTDMKKASQELSKVTELKRAIKVLKNKGKATVKG